MRKLTAGLWFKSMFKTGAALSVVALSWLAVVGAYAEAPLMSLPGRQGVNPGGASTYSIPITVPPGTAGMEPALSLEYSSQYGNGNLGIGWALAGLARIERCVRTYEQDGFIGGINYNADDRYCLNGERLVAVSGTYGANNTEYRTELETFSKVISYGTAGSGPQYFKVWTKSGQVMEFGNTADSRLMGGSNVRSWHVNRMTDTAGNYMVVTYTNDAVNRDLYPSKIDYTGNAAVTTPYNYVQFVYSERPDQVDQYYTGFATRQKMLLSQIRAYQGSTLVNDYRITYSLGNNVRPSRMQSIALCDGNGACLPATTFTWPAFNDPLVFTTTSYASSSVKPGSFTGDFNGDGLPDFFLQAIPSINGGNATASYWMSTGPGAWQAQSKTLGHSRPAGDLVDLALELHPMDFNADGYTDAIVRETDWFNNFNGTSVDMVGPYVSAYDINDKTGVLNRFSGTLYGYAPDNTSIADINGDGRDDLLMRSPPGINNTGALKLFSNGDGSFTQSGTIAGLTTGSTVYAGDFDGDGCVEGITQGATNQVLYACSGLSPVALPNWTGSGYKLVLGDYNGDGKTDVLLVHSTLATKLFLATGTGMVDTGYPGLAGWAKYRTYPGDFNGDGRTDLALIAASSANGDYGPPTAHQIYLSTGAGFVNAATISNSGSSQSVFGEAQDYNGDGIMDLWLGASGTTNTTRHTTIYQPMLLTSVTDGLGVVTTFTYKRLNDNTAASPWVTYVKGTGATYPDMDMTGPQYVVSQVQTSNGIGTNSTYYYQYQGARKGICSKHASKRSTRNASKGAF